MYVEASYPAVADLELTKVIIDTCKELGFPYHSGLTRSHDSFYIDDEEELMDYWNKKNILSSDMETGIIFTLAQLKGVKAASILNTVVEYESDVKDGIGDYVKEEASTIEGEKREIILALEAILRLEKN